MQSLGHYTTDNSGNFKIGYDNDVVLKAWTTSDEFPCRLIGLY